jgi:hypothetical protein
MAYETELVESPSMDVGRRGDEVVSRWGGIMAGTFVTLASLVLLGEIGAAIGLSAFEPGDRAAHYAFGAGIWGLLSVAIAFFLGGGASSCVSRLGRRNSGLLQGALVWSVTVPVIGFLGAILALGAVTAGSVTAAAAVTVDNATPAPDAMTPRERDEAARVRREATRPENIEKASKAAGAMGWMMVGGLLLSLGAAAVGGRIGAHYGAGSRLRDDQVGEARSLRTIREG